MANKSSKSPSGEDREHNENIRNAGVEKQDITGSKDSAPDKNTHSSEKELRQAGQENLQNRGIKEDQPHNPVRSTGSTSKDQESLPTGEPDPGEV